MLIIASVSTIIFFAVSCLLSWGNGNRTSCEDHRGFCTITLFFFFISNRTRSIVTEAYFPFFFFFPVYTTRGSCAFSALCLLLKTVLGIGRKAGALPLCCLLQWSAQRIWSSSERAFCAEVTEKKEKFQVRNGRWLLRIFFFFHLILPKI